MEHDKQKPIPGRERYKAHRKRRLEAGRAFVTVDLPVEIVEFIDRIKSERRHWGRAPIVEDAMRDYIEKHGA